ncbi:hypothetical protein LCGC14_1869070, partial [marine sediment metagenome]
EPPPETVFTVTLPSEIPENESPDTDKKFTAPCTNLFFE